MNEKAENLRRQIMFESQEVDLVQEEFDEIQEVVHSLVKEFSRVKFSTKVSQHMQYDSQTQFNENNITLYLAELEEYFASLLTYLAVQKGDQHAAISSVPLEVLNEKNFDKKELYIEAPYDTNRIGDNSTTGDEDEITNAKQLY